MDITFDRTPGEFPYVIWIAKVNDGIKTFLIEEDYPDDKPFQYLVSSGAVAGPDPFLHIAIADSVGNGNSCEILAS